MYRLLKDNNLLYVFPHPMTEVRELEDRFIVILQVPREEIFKDNVFCISKSGKLLWQIEDRGNNVDYRRFIGSSYHYNNLEIADNIGYTFTVDIDTGKILKAEFTK